MPGGRITTRLLALTTSRRYCAGHGLATACRVHTCCMATSCARLAVFVSLNWTDVCVRWFNLHHFLLHPADVLRHLKHSGTVHVAGATAGRCSGAYAPLRRRTAQRWTCGTFSPRPAIISGRRLANYYHIRHGDIAVGAVYSRNGCYSRVIGRASSGAVRRYPAWCSVCSATVVPPAYRLHHSQRAIFAGSHRHFCRRTALATVCYVAAFLLPPQRDETTASDAAWPTPYRWDGGRYRWIAP